MSIVLVFEDEEIERKNLVSCLKERLKADGVKIKAFDDTNRVKFDEKMSYEQYFLNWINNRKWKNDIGLIICDKELGHYKGYLGLSASPILKASEEAGLPYCQYSKRPTGREIEKFERLRRWSSGEITLEGNESEEWADQAAVLYRGFHTIKTSYNNLLSKKKNTPAKALANILGHPERETHIALYGTGKQEFLKEIFTYYDPKGSSIESLSNRIPRILGNWLFLSILRFPGIFVNQKAAASYLDINPIQFKEPKVQKLFNRARFAGPFSDLGPWWWRDELDIVLGEAQTKNGREYAKKKGVSDLKSCEDPDSKETPAGYYCMVTQEPVSKNNSKGGITWFPSGADLAHIRKDKYSEITSLVGLY